MIDAVETRHRVEKLVKVNPTITAAEIARQAGVSRARVSKLLDEMGYELVKVWRKRKRAKA